MRNTALYIAGVVLSLLVICNVKAQSSADTLHLKFNNISMNDKFKPFIEKLKQKKFRKAAATLEEGMLEGTLYFDKVTLFVVPSPVSDVVSYVLVVFDTGMTWSEASQKYSHYVNALTQKYGKPTDLSDEKSYVPLNKSYREKDRSILKKDGKTYLTSWIMPQGEISLLISEKFILSLSYYDRINLDKRTKEFSEVIDKEL